MSGSNPVQTLSRDDRSINDPDSSVGVLYDLLLSIQRSMETQHSEAVAKLMATERRIEGLESSMTDVISAIAIDPKLRASAIKDESVGVMTRTVMYRVPIILLKKLWNACSSIDVFLVPEEYLFKLASNIGPTHRLDVRQDLGGVFSQVLRDPGKVSLALMSTLMSDSTSKHSGLMRMNIMQVYKTMSVDLAFMIPQTLCNFIHRITDVDNSGQVGVSETAVMVKGVINPGKAYEAMGSQCLSTPALK